MPYWAKDIRIGYKAISARIGVADKPTFREAFKRRRADLFIKDIET